ncbi:DUF167 domain-containing protein [Francisellaceae bacterium CB299]|jgi:uncharacterized protein (TIGR00251 family)
MSFLLSIYVQPNSSKNEIVGEYNGMLKIKIKAPADSGKANKELVSFLAKYLNLKKNQITIIKGHISRQKIVSLEVEEIPVDLESFLISS